MKLSKICGWSSALCLSALIAQAQETNETEKLNKQLKQVQENLEKQQREMRENLERLVREQQAQIDALKKQIANVTNNAVAPTNQAAAADQLKELNDRVDQVVQAQQQVRPGIFNPAIGLVGETVFSYRSKGSDLTGSDRPGGFDVWQRSIELNIAAAIDPFAKGYAVINASADSKTGEATAAVEEAALQTTSLPWNLELKAGRFFGEFGRLAYIHDHELPFVNRPLVLDRYIGGESKTDGAQVNWLLPTSHYVSLTLGVGDQFGDDPNDPGNFRHFSEVNYFGRLSSFFNITPNWQVDSGISGLINPKSENGRAGVLAPSSGGSFLEQQRRVAGVDFRLSYVPLQNNQFQSFVWGTEVLHSANHYLFDPNGGPSPSLRRNVGSLGLYSYATYKWSRQWSGGFLFDWLQEAQNHNDQTFAYSPYLTFALSHWNQLRLQYTHTDHHATGGRSDDAIYLQWAWIIGAHSHGWQQR